MNALTVDLSRLRQTLEATRGMKAVGRLHRLVNEGLGQLPSPASGATLARWQALALVAQFDLSLVKLYEGHTDALAILHDLAGGEVLPTASTWGVWAAEVPGARVSIIGTRPDEVRLEGHKSWCSGAADISHALLTAWRVDGNGPQLVSVDLDQAEIEVTKTAWHAVGMAESSSLDVSFHGARARVVGRSGDYLSRPGFWHGGAGIAACWYGGALSLANTLLTAAVGVGKPTPSTPNAFRLAALGKVDVALQTTAALLRDAARWIDDHPTQDARALALRARLAAEDCAHRVLDEVGRSLGATPFCRDPDFARMAADLPVFIRQSHAERDFAALGEDTANRPGNPWML